MSGYRRLWFRAALRVLLVLTGIMPGSPVTAGEAGRSLAERVHNRPDGGDASGRGAMVLREPGHRPRVRRLFTYRLDGEGGRVWSLIRFTRPADIRGLGLLTWDRPGDGTSQWLYLPALQRSRRIAGERRGGRFVGSDLFYQDLRDRSPHLDRHRLKGRESVAGAVCQVLESAPKDPETSVYSRVLRWIHPRTLVPLRVDFFEAGRRDPIKRLRVHRLEQVQGYWTVTESTMRDLRSGHRTVLRVDRIVYDRGLPRRLFSRAVLEDPAREAPFRP